MVLMLGLRDAGLSYRAIGQKLKELGISTKQGKTKWSPKVIRDLVARQRAAA